MVGHRPKRQALNPVTTIRHSKATPYNLTVCCNDIIFSVLLPIIIMCIKPCSQLEMKANGHNFAPLKIHMIPPRINWMYVHDYMDI